MAAILASRSRKEGRKEKQRKVIVGMISFLLILKQSRCLLQSQMNDCNFDFSFFHPNQMSCMDVNSLLRNSRDPLSLLCAGIMMKILHLLCHFTISSLSSFLAFSFAIKKSSPVPKMHVLPHKIRCDQPFGKDSTASLPLFLHLPSSFVNMSMLVAELVGWDAGNMN